jgi:tartrate dehydrogenase/decarboxylase/D-malate dehydrogenase
MMLSFLAGAPGADAQRYQDAHDAILAAIEKSLKDGPRTGDLGGKATTVEVGDNIAALLQA